MRFIGREAISAPLKLREAPFDLLVSLALGIFISSIALHLIGRQRQKRPTRTILGAVLFGIGIDVMRAFDLEAFRSDAIFRIRPELFAILIIAAIVLAFLALEERVKRLRNEWPARLTTLCAALLIGCAVTTLHYGSLPASFFNSKAIPTGFSAPVIALPVTFIPLIIAGLAFLASITGRQSELTRQSNAKIARLLALQQEVQGNRARLQAIFDAVIDAIISIDKHGRILQWSSGAQRIFGYTSEEIIGKDFALLMPAAYMSTFLIDDKAKVIGTGRELVAVRKDGAEFPAELAISEVRNGDEIFFTGILRDITDRKRVETELVRAREQAEAANVAKSQFLATMSHEIRTPMNGVLGMAGLLASTPLNDRQRRLVENVTRSGQALLDIINDILNFAKIEAGKFELSAVPFDLHEAAAELTDLFAERCNKKGLEFIYFVAEDVPTLVIGDPARLRQILINLVGNAIKFTERGEILVEVSLERSNGKEVVLNFGVEDTGIGIPPDQCARIFDAFHQVDGSMNRARGGSGLGLSISRQLVEPMGGKITVESELGRGSRFSFTARFQRTGEMVVPYGARHLPRSLRVLLADANAVSTHVISLYLTNWQVSATTVSSVEEAELACRESEDHPFDAIILDVRGLGDRALDFARSINEQPRQQKCMKLILLVGIDNYLTNGRLEALGAAAILPKPVRASELFNTLVTIASDGNKHNLMPHFPRPKSTTDLPDFGARVLVAEDNPVNQEVATGILELLGCSVVTAPNGRLAFRQFTKEKFDLVLMDCEMPIMNGMEATRRIRQHELMIAHQNGRRS